MSLSASVMASQNYANVSKGSAVLARPNSTYIGIVTRIYDSNRVIVRIPKLNPNSEFGPCLVFGRFPEIGNNVLCTFIDGRSEHIVVSGTANDDGPDDRKTRLLLYMEVL